MHHARRRNRGADLRHAAHDVLDAQDGDQTLERIDAVLQRDHRRVRPDQRLNGFAGAFDVPQLDAEQHEIDRSDGSRVVGRLGRNDVCFATSAFDFQAIGFHGGQMCAARDEGDVRTGLGQRCPEGTADTASPDYRDFHDGSYSRSLLGIRS